MTAPIELQGTETYERMFDQLRASGYARVRIDGRTVSIDEAPILDRRRKHLVEGGCRSTGNHAGCP